MRRPYRALIALLFVVCHLRGIDAPPNGFHKWRETDTATVAENFATESMNFFAPRVNLRDAGDGVVGMELPVYNYATALLHRALGFSHLWPRLLSLIAGIWLLFGIYAMARKLGGDEWTARIAMFLAAFSPLVGFYATKIQPDVLGLALTVWGFVQFLDWTDGPSKRSLLTSAACLALAGAVKPTFLFVGLPMAWILWTERGRDFWREPAVWMLAGTVVLPAFGWLAYARGLSERVGSTYFYLGGDLLAEMQGLLSRQFYQNTLLTWPWEMALGLPATLILLLGFRRRFEGMAVTLVWLAGAFVVFAMAANHCATPHDYYFLPAVPALVFGAASVARRMLEQPSTWRRAATMLLLVGAAGYGVQRIQKRFDPAVDFAGARELGSRAVERGALVLAVDPLPGDVFYRAGLKGFRAAPPLTERDLIKASRLGAKYLVLPATESLIPAVVGKHVGARRWSAAGLTIYPLDVAPVSISMP